MNHSTRSQVLVIGDQPFADDPFTQRRLSLRRISLDQLSDTSVTNSACGVLLSCLPGKLSSISAYFNQWFCRAASSGLITTVLVKNRSVQVSEFRNAAYKKLCLFEDVSDLVERERRFDLLPWVHKADEEWKIAETLARYDAGPPIGKPDIVPWNGAVSLKPEIKLLLQRAFHDSARITVRALSGGRTAQGTFCVFANLNNGLYGPQPMPFFVKVDSCQMIQREMYNYREFVEPFIPFHLHPSINLARCANTMTHGALVCDFVENAVPLRDALRAGQADGAIFSLFEKTLRGIRSHTQKGPKQTGVIEKFLDDKVRAHEIAMKHPPRIEFLQRHGHTQAPQDVQSRLKKQATKILSQQGPFHGDLHFSNVMVRNGDAILIDFGSMGPFGPLYADPAILEVSLVFGTDNHDDPDSFEAWRDFVDEIYKNPTAALLTTGDFPHFSWLHSALRELRHVVACCDIGTDEAKIILAGCMLRYGRNASLPLRTKELDKLAEARRAYALVKAFELCQSL